MGYVSLKFISEYSHKSEIRGDLVNIKASVGICRGNNQGKDKLVVIPQNPDDFKNNELVLIISAQDFKEFSKKANGIIRFVEGVKELEDK